MRKGESGRKRAFEWYDVRAARGRMFAAGLAAVATYLGCSGFSWATRAVATWDTFAAFLLGLSWWMVFTADAKETARRAGAEDPGRTVAWVILLASCVFSLFAAGVVLRHAKTLAPDQASALVTLSLLAVALAWLLTHTSYTFRYAHLYYREDENGVGGLDFPGKAAPDDFDFAYFAFTIGMCFQVSDVVITGQDFRRHALPHALISFAYNTAVLTLALNLAFGLLG